MKIRAHSMRVHEQANLIVEDFEDKLLFKLTNKVDNKTAEKYYYKIDKMDTKELVKIDTILYHMHNEIGLYLWDN